MQTRSNLPPILSDPPDITVTLDAQALMDQSTTKLKKDLSFKGALNSLAPIQITATKDVDMDLDIEEDVNLESAKFNSTVLVNVTSFGDKINLSEEEKARIQRPWSFSVIIKLLGRWMSHDYLRHRLNSLWKPIEEIVLIDLDFDYLIVKFLKEKNMGIALQNRPWFINGFFLSIKNGTQTSWLLRLMKHTRPSGYACRSYLLSTTINKYWKRLVNVWAGWSKQIFVLQPLSGADMRVYV